MAYEINPEIYNYGNPVGNFMQGYQAAFIPQQLKAQQQAGQDQQKMDYLNRQYMQAKIDQMNSPQQDPANQIGFSGDVANAVSVENLARMYGEQDPRVVAARRSLTQQQQYQDSLNQYRNALFNTADKRSATNLGKMGLEMEDIKQGYLPASGQQIPIDQNTQQQLLDRYNLSNLKSTTDPQARSKTLYATNIDKTLGSIDPNALFQYSGPSGNAMKIYDSANAAAGNVSDNYNQYMVAKTNAQLLAHQIRQFYGDSIQPQMLAQLESFTNPESIGKPSKTAIEQFKAFSDLLGKETQTYRDSLKSPSVYQNKGNDSENRSSDQNYHDNDILTFENGEKMTAAEAKKKGYI